MGMLDRFRRTPEPLAAAAVRGIQPGQIPSSSQYGRQAAEAWAIYRCLGEVHYAVNQQARIISQLDWTVTIGDGEPMETEDSDALMRAAFGENVEALVERASQCLQVPGGYYLARTRPGDRDSWKVLSSPLSARNKKIAETSDVIVQVRIEDPEDDSRNDSWVLGAMDTARDLILCRAQSRAQSRSRTAQHGMLLYPIEGVKDAAQFEADLQGVITAPLSDERSTASVTPNLMGFPAEFIEKVRMLDMGGNYDEKLDAKDDRLVKSVAVQGDFPPELLLGFGDSNHWSTWAIQEDNWRGHTKPMADPIGNGFATAIMRATEATGIKVEPDPGPLLVRRPTVADTATAYENQVVSGDFYREQLGADETDAPTPEEIAARTPVAPAVEAPPAVAEPRAIAAALEGRMPQVAAVKRGPDPMRLQAIDTQAFDSVEDLVNDTADRAMERLGAKVRTMAQGSGIDLPADKTNAQLAVAFTGTIPNADAAIADTITAALPRLDRVMVRAYTRLRGAGVDARQDPDDETSARALFTSLVAGVVATRMQDKAAVADAWQAARRVVAVAGGNSDPATIGRAS